MQNTDYVIRAVAPAGKGRVTVTVVDMGGQVRQVTMTADTYNFGNRDRLLRAVIANNRTVRTLQRKATHGRNV